MNISELKRKNIPWAAVILIAVNVIVMVIVDIQKGGAYGVSSLQAEYSLKVWQNMEHLRFDQLIGCMFLHSGFEHLANNMLALYCMGYALENTTGHIRFAIAYFFCGIVGEAVSVWWYIRCGNYMVSSVGASAAVFGMSGLLLGMVILNKGQIRGIPLNRVVLMFFLTLTCGFNAANVNNCAHIAGAAAGLLISPLIYFLSARRGKKNGFDDQIHMN